MWEVRGYHHSFNELLQWVCDVAVPAMEQRFEHLSSEVFASADHRVVVVSRWRADPVDLPTPPADLATRSAHSWDFTPVDR